VAILGGGTMGSGIVAVYLLKGYNVILKEINEKFLNDGLKRVSGALRARSAAWGGVHDC
jgi:3-hydroxyacyl-CoA dehydrogenase